METDEFINGTILGWFPHSSRGYVCLLLATGDGSSCAIVNLREKVAVKVLGPKSRRGIRNGTVADVQLDVLSEPFTDQYKHADVRTQQYWASNIILQPGRSALDLSKSLSRLSLNTLPLNKIVQCTTEEGLTDVLGRVERIEPYSHDGRVYLLLRDETTTIRVIIWPEHKKRLPNIVNESTILYMKNVRFKYGGSYCASCWNMFVFANVQNERTESLKRMPRSDGASLTCSPMKFNETNKTKNDIKLHTLEEVIEGLTGDLPVVVECQIHDLVSTDFMYQACTKCFRKLQVRRGSSSELEHFCASCNQPQVTPNHRYKIMVWLKDENPLLEVKAFLDDKVAENLLGMTANKLHAKDIPNQIELVRSALVNKWFTVRVKRCPAADRFMPGGIKYSVIFAVEKVPAVQDSDAWSIEEVTDSSEGMQPATGDNPQTNTELPEEIDELLNASELKDVDDFEMSEMSSSLPECSSGKSATAHTPAAKCNGDNRGSSKQPNLPSSSKSDACWRPRMPQTGKRCADRTESSDEELLMSPPKKRASDTQSTRIISADSSDEDDDDSQMNKLVQQKCFLPGYYTLAKYGSGYYPAVITKLPTARVGYHVVKFLDSHRKEERSERDLLRPSVWLLANREIWVFTVKDRLIARTWEHYESGILLDWKQRKGKPPVFKVEVIRDKNGKRKVRKVFNVRFRDVAVMNDLAGINRPYDANIGAEADLDDDSDMDEWESEASVKLSGDSEDDMEVGSGSDCDQDFIDDTPQEDPLPSPSVSSGFNAAVVDELDALNDEVADNESEESHDSNEENDDDEDDEEDDEVVTAFAPGESVFARWNGNKHYYVANVSEDLVPDGNTDCFNVLFRDEKEPQPVDYRDVLRLTDVVKGGHKTMYFCDADNDEREGTIDKIMGEGANTTVRIRFLDKTRETHGLERLCFTDEMIKRRI